MKWYEREYGFKGQPYPLFLTDVVWSAVVVAVAAVGLFDFGAAVPVIAGAVTVLTFLLGRMVVRRAAEHRARMGLAPAPARGFTPLGRSRSPAGI